MIQHSEVTAYRQDKKKKDIIPSKVSGVPHSMHVPIHPPPFLFEAVSLDGGLVSEARVSCVVQREES